jgi:hypothetical protein
VVAELGSGLSHLTVSCHFISLRQASKTLKILVVCFGLSEN